MKKRYIFTGLFAVIAVILIVVGMRVLSKRDREQTTAPQPTDAYTFIDDAYWQQAAQIRQKLYSTHIDGLFYSLSPTKYYYVDKDKCEEQQPVETLQLNPTVAGTSVQLEIPVVEIGKTRFGVGIWHADDGVYNDVFALLSDMPEAGISSAPYLLALDTAQNDKNADERLYSELFAVSESGGCEYLFDQGNRMTEQSGKLRTDWACATATMMFSQSEGMLTLSGKKYNRTASAQLFDLLCTRNGQTTTVAEKVSAHYAAYENGVSWQIKDKKSAWELLCTQESQTKSLGTFEGSFASDYRLLGDYALKKSDGSLIYLKSAKQYNPPGDFKKLYAVDVAGDSIVYIGKEPNKEGKDYKVQKIVVTDTKGKQTAVFYGNDIMDENSSLFACRSGIITQKEGKSVFISYKALARVAQDVVK